MTTTLLQGLSLLVVIIVGTTWSWSADRIIGVQSARSMSWSAITTQAFVFGAVVALFYVIYVAPAFLAEILIDRTGGSSLSVLFR